MCSLRKCELGRGTCSFIHLKFGFDLQWSH